jgi:hypothetical protein
MDLEDQLSLASLSQQREIKRALQKANELADHKRIEAENHKLRQELLYQTKQQLDQIEYLLKNKKHVMGCFQLKKTYKQFNDASFTSDEFSEIEYKELLKKLVHSFDVTFRWIKTNVSLRDFQLADVRYRNLEAEKKQLQEKKILQDALKRKAQRKLAGGRMLCAFFVFIGSCLGGLLTSHALFFVTAGVSLLAIPFLWVYSD